MRSICVVVICLGVSAVSASLAEAQTWAAGLTVVSPDGGRAGATVYPSSGSLRVSWTAPAEAVHHYLLTLTDGVTGAPSVLEATDTRVTVSGLKSGTAHTAMLKACLDQACAASLDADAPASGRTAAEYWQVQGTGNSYSTATKIVSDGNTYAFGVPYGAWAGASLSGKVQLYYNPFGASEKGIKIGEMTSGTLDSVASLASYRPVSGFGLLQICGFRAGEPFSCPGDSVAVGVTTTQAIPLDASMGGGIRLFFEAQGTDQRTRVMYLDSRDGYVGRDFNAGDRTICGTLADYSAGGGCVPTVVVGVQGDAIAGNQGLSNARQFKIGYPTRTDWRWNGAPGTFMLVTAEFEGACSSDSFFNTSYAVWDGVRWVMQTDAAGCPRFMTEMQAPMVVHMGGTRYKTYFSHNPIRRGGMSNPLTDLKPLKVIYADGGTAGDPATVDFEDWETVAQARDVHVLWPDGSEVNAQNESALDDYMMFMPTGNPALQVMYSNMSTPGTGLAPVIGMAVLVNP
ncbi:MAG: hypothetical protein A3F70_01670 [Acidobacteria bacterium RIFCSPLOWO2_12_FULL_67_14]|nr:MAG: hypothetical protein A3H29_05005 [Acidobacteria bacterium RIFCSPLOWO2_02_FULL_67_21]OFW37435.1 MAG: hypothetical protein A3F70_01670 [Acidobacteria bacterium RIFCSPLOWO2_12_FULL_67_14]